MLNTLAKYHNTCAIGLVACTVQALSCVTTSQFATKQYVKRICEALFNAFSTLSQTQTTTYFNLYNLFGVRFINQDSLERIWLRQAQPTLPRNSSRNMSGSPATPRNGSRNMSGSSATLRNGSRNVSGSSATPRNSSRNVSGSSATPRNSSRNVSGSLATPRNSSRNISRSLATPRSRTNQPKSNL